MTKVTMLRILLKIFFIGNNAQNSLEFALRQPEKISDVKVCLLRVKSLIRDLLSRFTSYVLNVRTSF